MDAPIGAKQRNHGLAASAAPPIARRKKSIGLRIRSVQK